MPTGLGQAPLRSVLFLFSLQHGFEVRKRIKRSTRALAATGRGIAAPRLKLPLVLVVMTIQTQQFPVTAIARIIIMIVVTVMHRQLMHILVCEFPAAAPANRRIHLQRLLTISLIPQLAGSPRFTHNLMQSIFIRFCHTDLHIADYPGRIQFIIMLNIVQRRPIIQ